VTALQLGLFGGGEAGVDPDATLERTDLGGGAWVEVRRAWLRGADTLCQELIRRVAWRHHRR